jgi:uncharacterized lipoprotein NlpE involved in copper resistance
MKLTAILILSILTFAIVGCDKKEVMPEQAPPKVQKVVMVPSQHESTPAANPGVPANTGPKTDDTAKQPGDK